jgi:hypothetical protein
MTPTRKEPNGEDQARYHAERCLSQGEAGTDQRQAEREGAATEAVERFNPGGGGRFSVATPPQDRPLDHFSPRFR